MHWVGAILLGCLASCGLLSGDPSGPPLDRAREVKAEASAEWQRLAQLAVSYEQEGLAAVEVELADLERRTLREDVLLQDLRAEEWAEERLYQHYDQRYLVSRDGASAYLLARLVEEERVRERLLEEAHRAAPQQALIEVELIALLPYRVGEDEALTRLLQLLKDDPGLAEGWRLLRQLAPRYGRPDLACDAADLEPWSPLEDPHEARLDQVRTCLMAGRAERALERLDRYQLQDREAVLLRASALAELGRAADAWSVLQELRTELPNDPLVAFNLGLLARDYLGQPGHASVEFARFLELAAAAQARGESVDPGRVLQAKAILRELSREDGEA